MAFDLDGWLKVQKGRVEGLLEQRMRAIAGRSVKRLSDAMAYSLLDSGKRLRPILCLAFADAAARASNGGGEPANDAACALECIHTYSLIHDDLPAMDDDDLRRGRPTSHKVYGEALAILAGDALLTDAFAMVATGPESERAVRAQLVSELALAAGAGGMVGGQVLDIAEDRPAEEAYLLKLHGMKTGALIKAACRMGAIAGGGGELQAAELYGAAVGLAFQIADDLLDLSSTPEQLGKPVGADAAAGRFTFPAVVGLERSQKMASELVEKAKDAVRILEPSAGPLAALADYSIGRKN
jgi:geranylgeranyl diphosphate synthase, type II